MKLARTRLAAVLAGVAALAGGATATAQSCRLPDHIQPAPRLPTPDNEVSRAKSDHYLLSLSWSPEWCRAFGGDQGDKLQCRDNSFGFVVHGLWPSAARGAHARYCAAAPPLDAETVRRHLCMTPSAALLQHEWAAHGTCGWPTSAAYFEQAAALWNALRMPDLTAPTLTAGQVRDAFIVANPQLPRHALFVRVATGNRLQEVGVCYDLKFRVSACPRGIGTPDAVTLRITPRD